MKSNKTIIKSALILALLSILINVRLTGKDDNLDKSEIEKYVRQYMFNTEAVYEANKTALNQFEIVISKNSFKRSDFSTTNLTRVIALGVFDTFFSIVSAEVTDVSGKAYKGFKSLYNLNTSIK